ncbi:putative uncharacterized protein [Rhodococcus sp. AW25M09]|nr:putative uncharacterized protein [Rhodococcus sp. AW25M09]
MQPWSQRSSAVADLLNPAIIAAAIAAAAVQYERRDHTLMPFELSFLVVPLVLHRDTRTSLPTRVDSHLARWVTSNPLLAAGFGARAKALTEPVREGIRFGLRCGALHLDGPHLSGQLRRRPAVVGDVTQIISKAGFVGRWFAQLESSATAFALLGVKV